MKIKILLAILFSMAVPRAQSVLTIGTIATLEVSIGADICSDSLSGSVTGDGSFCGNPTEVKTENVNVIPDEFTLGQNYPNPFNPATTVSFQLPVNSLVTLIVYDLLGREIATLVDEYKTAGTYHVQFTMNNLASDKQNVSSGIYYYQLKAGDYLETKKMILLK